MIIEQDHSGKLHSSFITRLFILHHFLVLLLSLISLSPFFIHFISLSLLRVFFFSSPSVSIFVTLFSLLLLLFITLPLLIFLLTPPSLLLFFITFCLLPSSSSSSLYHSIEPLDPQTVRHTAARSNRQFFQFLFSSIPLTP